MKKQGNRGCDLEKGRSLKANVETLFSSKVRVNTILCNLLLSLHNSRELVKRPTLNEGQAKKSARGMPWHQEPMKDVTSCEKLRGAANER